jgi:hypothetical protein
MIAAHGTIFTLTQPKEPYTAIRRGKQYTRMVLHELALREARDRDLMREAADYFAAEAPIVTVTSAD